MCFKLTSFVVLSGGSSSSGGSSGSGGSSSGGGGGGGSGSSSGLSLQKNKAKNMELKAKHVYVHKTTAYANHRPKLIVKP